MVGMRRVVGLLLGIVLAVAGCGGSSRSDRPATGPATPAAGQPSTAPSAAPTSSSPSASASSGAAGGGTAQAAAAPRVPRFKHVVVVVEENHAKGEIIGNRAAPFMNALARTGAQFTRSYAITHPSYPNYLALFSGSTHGVHDDSCPHYYRGNDLGAQLRAKGYSFVGYAQGLPRVGYRGCTAGAYARRHVPWVDFENLPRTVSRPMTDFPRDFTRLPRLAFVIPDVDHDMHDGTVAQADRWLKAQLGRYVSWARTHDSLLVLTWDEDDRSAGNHILTVFNGASVKAGRYATRVDHYRVLRTLEASFGLAPIGHAADRTPITGVWSS